MSPRSPTKMITTGQMVRAAVIAVVFVGAFGDFFYNQALFSLDPDWSHAFFVPLISVYYVYENRRRILTLPVTRNWLGPPAMIMGIAVYFFFTLGSMRNHALQAAGVMLCLLGLMLTMVGWRMWRALLFPQLYLIAGLRLPPPLLLQVTPTLQNWAAQGSYYLLNILGYRTEIRGNILEIFHDGRTVPLNVAEACSGMRMIVAFVALGIAIAFLSCRWWWQRIALVAMAVPIAVFINVLRVASIGIMATVDPDWAGGDAHVYIGMLWLVPAFVLYLGVVWILQHLILDSDSSATDDSRPPGSADAGVNKVGSEAPRQGRSGEAAAS